ncbi:MAG TPA: DoxX family protein [Vicinamibacterales bacterium]
MAVGLLFFRLVLGTLMAGHGAQKLFGWFGGYGLSGTGAFFEQIGFRPGRVFATAAALGEIISGVLVAIGFGGPLGPALMLSVMIVAAFSVHWGHGIFAASNGVEVPLIYAAGAIALALSGPGRYSVDGWLGWTALSPTVAWTALVIGAVGAYVNLAIRRSSGSLQHKAA